MKFVKVLAVIIAVSCIAALPVCAKQPGKAAVKGADKSTASATAGDKLTNELVDAVTRPLASGTSSGSGPSSVPPGLAKKDKTPPGWDKGKKTGWNKEESKAHQDSLVDKAVKAASGTAK